MGKLKKIADHRLFLYWWLFAVSIKVFVAHLYINGVVSDIWNSDVTKLSFVIFGLFFILSFFCGKYISKASSFLANRSGSLYSISEIKKKTEVGWFSSDMMLSIGMVGTVIGFILMLSGFGSINIAEIGTIEQLIRELGVGMSTALYTTLSGLVCSILLKAQLFYLNYMIEKIEDEEKLSF